MKNRTLLEWAGIALTIALTVGSVYAKMDARIDDLDKQVTVMRQHEEDMQKALSMEIDWLDQRIAAK